MNVNIQFQNPTLNKLAATYEQKFTDLKRERPDCFTDVLFVRFGNEPHLEFDYFVEVVRSVRRRTPREETFIFTRLETRVAEAPRLSYIVPSYCDTPALTVTHADSLIATNEKSHQHWFAREGPCLKPTTEAKDEAAAAVASLTPIELADADADSLDDKLSEVSDVLVSLYNALALTQLMEKEKTKHKDDQRRLTDYETMKRLGSQRCLKKAPALDSLAVLGRRFPNFGRAMESILGAAALSHLADGPFSFPPMLLVGPPGVGKTYFASELAKLVGVDHQFISMETMQASWVLTGTHNGWATAEIGRIGECLIRSEMANPLFLIDEVDKALTGNYNPLAPLYALLEPRTAANFRDEYLSIELNASHANWIMTANETKSIPVPLLSRMSIVEVPAPTRDEAALIARQIYNDLLQSESWGGCFESTPSEALIEGLLSNPPRSVRAVLLEAFGRAAFAGRDRVEKKDLRLPAAAKNPIGFSSALL